MQPLYDYPLMLSGALQVMGHRRTMGHRKCSYWACMAEGPYQKKDDWTRPMVWLSQPYCWLIGSTAMLIFTRSMLHSMKAKKHSVTIVQRRFQNGWLTVA